MKRVFDHPEPKKEAPNAHRQYWRSVGELEDTPEFRSWLEKEFPAGAAEIEADGVSRRNFLQLMGASLALAGFGVAGCRRPEAYIVPYTKGVEWVIPGKPLLYATSMPRKAGAMPLVVTTYEGRPTKIEGNPLHPASNGGTDLFAQASVLELYDTDRSKHFLKDGKGSDKEAFVEYLKVLTGALKEKGKKLVILTGRDHSPTRQRLREELEKAFPNLVFAVYDPLEPIGYAATLSSLIGEGNRLHPRLDKAKTVLAIDSDFMCAEELGVEATNGFASGRRLKTANDPMNRLYVVENRYTVTGGQADHRLRCSTGRLGVFTVQLAKAIAEQTGNGELQATIDALPESWKSGGFDEKWVNECAKDLVKSGKEALVLTGNRQPAAGQALVLQINQALGGLGNTLEILPDAEKPAATLADVHDALEKEEVGAFIMIGGNPLYASAGRAKLAELLEKVPDVIRLGLYYDESSKASKWQVPAAHYLESWGDVQGTDGTYAVVQPMILPLYGGLSELDLYQLLLGQEPEEAPTVVQETFKKLANPSDFDMAWNSLLRDGFVPESAPTPVAARIDAGAATKLASEAKPITSGMELVLIGDATVGNGHYANVSWLQELPDPITKQTWGNAALMSLETAKKLGITKDGQMVKISLPDQSVEIPAFRSPGHADNSVSVALGYGRDVIGQVGKGHGVDVYGFMTPEQEYVVSGVQVAATGGYEELAQTQEHQSMEGRALVREAPIDYWRGHQGVNAQGKGFAALMWIDSHVPPNVNIYQGPGFHAPHQWGMAIDLTTCTGCNACVIACQAENNIPVVGKEQVINGRVMHWIRNDRYFSSVEDHHDDPEMLTMPMLCQQCENAPCETVCPVNATVHNEEGLNVMAYNRCIGTRYCANNCPYKVRRFNFFDYNKRDVYKKVDIGPIETGNLYLGPLGEKQNVQSLEMQRNPNVTVRMRGVIEKCTFCVQRLENAKINRKVEVMKPGAVPAEELLVQPGGVKTACQQVCPTGAITFGNIADDRWEVTEQIKSDRGYKSLDYLNVRPRITYLARIRNPNPEMPGADHIGMSSLADAH